MGINNIYQPTNIYESDINNYHNNRQLNDNKVKFNDLLEETKRLQKRGTEYNNKKIVTNNEIKKSNGTDIAAKELATEYTKQVWGIFCNMMYNSDTGNSDKSFAEQVFSEELIKSLVTEDMVKNMRDNIYEELKSNQVDNNGK